MSYNGIPIRYEGADRYLERCSCSLSILWKGIFCLKITLYGRITLQLLNAKLTHPIYASQNCHWVKKECRFHPIGIRGRLGFSYQWCWNWISGLERDPSHCTRRWGAPYSTFKASCNTGATLWNAIPKSSCIMHLARLYSVAKFFGLTMSVEWE